MKKIFALTLPLLLALSLLGLNTVSAAQLPKPHIAVDSVPAIGKGTSVEGHVWFDGSGWNYSDYTITMALEVTRGGAIWAPKPTAATPTVSLDSDGHFSCAFVSGGDDIDAERLYVYLVPSDFVPDADTGRTAAASLDNVIIDRYADGTVNIRQLKEPILIPDGPPPYFNPQQKHPANTDKLSICYSPYTNGLSPETNSAVPMDQMLWQLNLVYPYADTIRLFGVSGELEKIYKPAKEEYHFRVIAGAWIDKSYTQTQVYAELDKLIGLANDGYVDVAVVGSECINRKDFTADQMVTYIQYVRAGIKDKSIQVGTSDVPDAFLNNQQLAANSDVVLCTIYPFFANVAADKAAQNLADTYDRVKAAAGGKQVIISECGWPTEGSPEGAAVPGEANARTVFEATYNWSRQNDVEIVYFSEIDEAYKVEGVNGDIGGHWGQFTSTGVLKDAYLPTYQAISPQPVLDTDVAKWADQAIQDLVGKGILNTSGPSLYEPLTPITRGDFIHYLVKAMNLESKTGQAGATFSDVDPNIYYYFTVGAGQKAGLVAGVGGNLCQPDAQITRQDMFALIYRALNYAGMNLTPDASALAKFHDSGKISAYAKDAISALTANGLIAGDQNGNVNPLDNASRAEAAVLLYRV
ncbi:MAG: S-layer homology domain-containing protein, partial [Defluviitaleaceae bacterium]|nr:S-layer homology domain-containing protein [Defluviitaleaceae bacterium]